VASCILLHGPGARQAAYSKAIEVGHLSGDFGDTEEKRAKPKKDQTLFSLNVAEAREAMALLLDTPLYDSVGCVVIGPVDEAQAKATDVLLKGIEEFAEGVVQPILWAYDYGSVSATVRSRCMEQWVPGAGESDEDEDLVATAWVAVDNALSGDVHLIPSDVQKFAKKTRDVLSFLKASADAVSTDLDCPKRRALWERLRKVASHYNPTPTELISALMGVG
jgi:hypothetical protein